MSPITPTPEYATLVWMLHMKHHTAQTNDKGVEDTNEMGCLSYEEKFEEVKSCHAKERKTGGVIITYKGLTGVEEIDKHEYNNICE